MASFTVRSRSSTPAETGTGKPTGAGITVVEQHDLADVTVPEARGTGSSDAVPRSPTGATETLALTSGGGGGLRL